MGLRVFAVLYTASNSPCCTASPLSLEGRRVHVRFSPRHETSAGSPAELRRDCEALRAKVYLWDRLRGAGRCLPVGFEVVCCPD